MYGTGKKETYTVHYVNLDEDFCLCLEAVPTTQHQHQQGLGHRRGHVNANTMQYKKPNSHLKYCAHKRPRYDISRDFEITWERCDRHRNTNPTMVKRWQHVTCNMCTLFQISTIICQQVMWEDKWVPFVRKRVPMQSGPRIKYSLSLSLSLCVGRTKRNRSPSPTPTFVFLSNAFKGQIALPVGGDYTEPRFASSSDSTETQPCPSVPRVVTIIMHWRRWRRRQQQQQQQH
jgi:hypothetical protein